MPDRRELNGPYRLPILDGFQLLPFSHVNQCHNVVATASRQHVWVMRVPGHVEVDARGLDSVCALVRSDVPGPSQTQGESFHYISDMACLRQGCKKGCFGLWASLCKQTLTRPLHTHSPFIREYHHIRQAHACKVSYSGTGPIDGS